MKSYPPRLQQEDLYSIPIDEFFKSAFSVDCVIFGYHERELKILLIQRGTNPYENYWALPGDLVYPNEDLAPEVLEYLSRQGAHGLTVLHFLFLDDSQHLFDLSLSRPSPKW